MIKQNRYGQPPVNHPYDLIRACERDDLIEINGWYRARKEPMLPAELMPPQGFIVPGVAAGFLIRTTTNIAILESFVSNPEASKIDRAMALDKIAESLISAAKSSGIISIIAITEHGKIKDLCTKHNFKRLEGLEIWARGN